MLLELFRPYFSQILGNFIAHEMTAPSSEHSQGDQPQNSSQHGKFQVVELGGGRGTNALCILDHLMDIHPDIYHRLESYTIVDASPTLLDLQRKILMSPEGTKVGKRSRHVNKINFIEKDLMEVAEKK